MIDSQAPRRSYKQAPPSSRDPIVEPDARLIRKYKEAAGSGEILVSQRKDLREQSRAEKNAGRPGQGERIHELTQGIHEMALR